MGISSKAVANYFLDWGESTGTRLDHMKLQKLVYYPHGWYTALTGGPLITEAVEAWDYGPVIPDLYREFREYGDQPITSKAINFDEFGPHEPSVRDSAESRFIIPVLDRVWSELLALYFDPAL